MDLPAEFWAKVDASGGCWLWLGRGLPAGYGRFSLRGRDYLVHRLSFLASGREIPAGYEIDHLCRVRNCVNPAHLEAVTHRENMLRGNTIVAACARRTECPRGHAYDDTNTLTHRGSRYCRLCANAKLRVYAAKRKGRNSPKTIEEALALGSTRHSK